MKEVVHHKYSLFLLEKRIGGEFLGSIFTSCFEYLITFDTLEEVMAEQKMYDLKTIIISTY